MFSLIWSVIVGFLVGLLARALMPGPNPMGFVATSAVGIVGSLIGGFLGGLLRKSEPYAKFHPAGFLMSIVGAVILLYVLRLLR